MAYLAGETVDSYRSSFLDYQDFVVNPICSEITVKL